MELSERDSQQQLESDNGYFVLGEFWPSFDSKVREAQVQDPTLPRPLRLPKGIPDDIDLVSCADDYMVVGVKARAEYWIIVPRTLHQLRGNSDDDRPLYCEHRKTQYSFINHIMATSIGVFVLTGHGELVQVARPPVRNQLKQLVDNQPPLLISKLKPVPVLDAWRVKEVSTGKGFVIALALSGLVFAWGDNRYGQLGIGPEAVGIHVHQPVELEFLNSCRVECVAAGHHHAGAIGTTKSRLHLDTAMDRGKPERVVFTWGRGDFGCLGHGDMFLRDNPTTDTHNARHDSTMGSCESTTRITESTTASTSDRSNHKKQKERAISNICHTPKCIQSLRAEKREVVRLALGGAHSLGLLQQSTVMAWGQGTYGQLGTQHVEDEHTPVDIPNLGLVDNLFAGLRNSFAVTSQGFIFAWGYNNYGEFGIGDRDIRLLPEPITTLMHTKANHADCGNSRFAVVAAKAVSSFETNVSLEFYKPWCHNRVCISKDKFSVLRYDLPRQTIPNGGEYDRFLNSDEDQDDSNNEDQDFQHLHLDGYSKNNHDGYDSENDDKDDDASTDNHSLFLKYLYGHAGPMVGKGQYRWNVVVESLNSETQSLGIGVASPDDLNPYVASPPFLGECWLYLQSQEKYGNATTSDYGEFFIEGDEIGVILDLEIGTLEFSRRGKRLGIAFDTLPQNKPLCLCIALAASGDIVTILPPKQTATDIVDEAIKFCFNDIGVEKSTGMEVFYKCGPCKRLVCRACARICHEKHQRSLLINYNATKDRCNCNKFTCQTKILHKQNTETEQVGN